LCSLPIMVKLWRCFFFPLSFCLFNIEKHVTLVKKLRKVCYLLVLSYLIPILLIVSNIFFFQFHHLAFNFYIKFVLLFYVVSGLTLNILISNLDFMLFYQILISFPFHPWIYDLNFNFFYNWFSFSWFLFFFWILL
jgi:hypothetical protein